MKKIMIFQHVAHEILGTLNPLLKHAGLRIRYVNFDRHPELNPSLENYHGLVVLGGPMSVCEADKHQHLRYEIRAIEQALKMDIPVLGICLGAQLLAQTLGAQVRKNTQPEIGWYDVHFTSQAKQDPLFTGCQENTPEKIFQWHADTFDIPPGCQHLAWSEICQSQAFRYADKVYGLQFHLEVDKAMICRWLQIPGNINDLKNGNILPETILKETEAYISGSLKLSHQVFSQFADLFGSRPRTVFLDSGHGKPRR